MDIGAAQDFFGRQGQLSRIDVKLRPGVDRAAFLRSLRLPAGVVGVEPLEDAQRVSNLSRAYRVNLAVLALVALFTGAFLVYSVLSLSVARRAQQFALLGVLGLTAGQRRRLVLAESLVLGLGGSALGIALGDGAGGTGIADAGRRPGRRLLHRSRAATAMERVGGVGLRGAGHGGRRGRRLVAGARGRSNCRWRKPSRGWAQERLARGGAPSACC